MERFFTRPWAKRIGLGVLLLAGTAGGGAVGALIATTPAAEAKSNDAKTSDASKSDKTEATERGDLTQDEQQTVDLFEKAAPSVVYITRMMKSPMSLDASELPAGTGSGFVWDDAGHIVTNFHVVQGASKARVTLSDRSTYDAKIVGTASEKDIAVLEISAPTSALVPLSAGASGGLLVGQQVYAIGNPFGLDHTLSTGVISGLGREIKSVSGFPIVGVVQTDAAINPGNSGGPLLDSHGRLIGINTAIYSPSGASAGIGFAVPVDTVKRIVPELIKHGKVTRPALGVEIADGVEGVEGVVIMNVREGTGAEAAGLHATRRDEHSGRIVLGDVIVGIDSTVVKENGDLFKALDAKQVGDVVKLTVERNGEKRTVSIKLGEIDSE